MGDQTSHAPVPVEEGVNPEQTMVGGGHSENRLESARRAIRLLETEEESRHRTGADGAMPPHLDVLSSQLAAHDRECSARLRLGDFEEFGRQQGAEASVDLTNGLGGMSKAIDDAQQRPDFSS